MTRDKNQPPLCNTGAEKQISLSIDWIEGTYKTGQTPRPMPLILTEKGEECTGFHGYTIAHKYEDGRLEMINPSRPDMGYHIQWSGTAMQSTPVDGLSLVAYLEATHFTFTRLDLAIDVIGHQFSPSLLTREIANGDYISRAKKFPQWGDPANPGYTQYVGKRPSEIYLCVYDKAAELGIRGDYTRVELRCSGKRAKTAAQAILRDSDFRKLVLGFIRFPKLPQWNEIMGIDAVKIPKEQKIGATKEWLLSQCAPALGRILDEEKGDEFWLKFLAQVKANRE